MIASKHKIPKRWLDLFALLPGYDPVATADDCHFEPRVADSVVSFFERELIHVEGKLAGHPLVLQPWQQAIVGCAFAWFRPDGTRRYREVFQYVPRKNGKSTMLAGLICLMAFCDDEPGAQIYSAAADREQAALVYRQAKGMILANEGLSARTKIYVTYKSMEFQGQASTYKALSAEADTKHGYNSHFIIVDELHAQPNRELVDVLLTSTGSRTQPLVWFITTADYDRESICNEKYDYACKIRDGIIDDKAFLPIIYEASRDDDWHDPAVWRKANPNLGVSIGEEYFKRECKRADDQPSYTNTFLRLHLNIRTTNDQKFFDMPRWDSCGMSVDIHALAGRKCYLGLDLSSTTDITCLSMVFPPSDEHEPWKVWPIFWVPSDNARKREMTDHVPYLQWINEGLIRTTPGERVDYDYIRKEVNHLAAKYAIRHVLVDPWNATQLMEQLSHDGFAVVKYQQSMSNLTAPTKEIESLVMSGKLAHGGNKVLRWMAQNTAIETNALEQIRPSKKRSAERIDGIVATIMGIGGALSDKDKGPSVYESRGLVEV